MIGTPDRFVIDEQGNKTAVLISLERYKQLLEAEEDLACVRIYDREKAQPDEMIPFDQAMREIENGK